MLTFAERRELGLSLYQGPLYYVAEEHWAPFWYEGYVKIHVWRKMTCGIRHDYVGTVTRYLPEPAVTGYRTLA